MKKVLIIIISVLSLCAAALGALASLNHIHYKVEQNTEFTITTEDDFYLYIEHYNQYNVVRLEKNLELKLPFTSIGTKKDPYKNVFDGQGYSITLLEEAKNTPLFGTISESGVVKNLELFVNNCEITTASYGALAIQNKGTIINCIIELTASVNADTMASAIACINEGSISYCHAKSIITNNINSARKESIIASCVAFNNGSIDSLISYINYTNFTQIDSEEILNGELNNTIGAVYGINNSTSSKISNCYYSGNKKMYVSDMKYVKNLANLNVSFDEATLLNTFHFNNKIWNLSLGDAYEIGYEISLKDGVSV